MMVELTSGTDAASHVIYDPAATAHLSLENLRDELYEKLYEEESRKGNLISYSEASDGSTRFRIYIDEPLPDEFVNRAEAKTENLLLKVPSGTLVAGGIEYVNDTFEIEKAAPPQHGKYALVSKIEFPKGNYLVDAYEFEWDWGQGHCGRF